MLVNSVLGSLLPSLFELLVGDDRIVHVVSSFIETMIDGAAWSGQGADPTYNALWRYPEFKCYVRKHVNVDVDNGICGP